MNSIYRHRQRRSAALPEVKATGNLSNLRQSVAWSTTNSRATSAPTAAIEERLEQILVLELRKDGQRKYLNVTGRSLYRHVLQAITHRDIASADEDEAKGGEIDWSRKTVAPTIDMKTSINLDEDNDVPTMPRPDLMSKVPVEISETEMVKSTTTSGTTTASEAGDSTKKSSDAAARPSTPAVMEVQEEDDKMRESVTFVPVSSMPKTPNISRYESVSHFPPKPPNSGARTMDVEAEDTPRTPITYRERLGGYLHPRDMRRLVTPFSPSNEPELIVRRHVMLLNFDPLRAIILRDRLIVLVPDGADSMLVYLEERAQGGQVGMERAFFGSTANETRQPSDDRDGGSISGNNNMDESVSSKRSGLFGKIAHKATKLASSVHGGSHSKSSDAGADNRSANVSGQSTIDDGNDDDEDGIASDDTDETTHDKNEEEDEWDELEGKEWIELPFELACADAVLYTVTNFLAQDTHELQEATLDYLQRILKNNNGMGDDPLTIIRMVKDSIREMTSRVKGFAQSLNRILDEDEDMALMNLSRLLTHPERFIKPVPPEILEEESDEPEIILESHLQQALSLMNALNLIQGQVDSAAELIDQKLDATRNKILLANMILTTLSLCLSVAMLVGGFFGMNLVNHIEDDPTAFAKVTYGTLAGSACLGCFILTILYFCGVMPRYSESASSSL